MGIFKVFDAFRRLLDALNGLAAAVQDLTKAHGELGPAADRLAALELWRPQIEAELSSKLLTAEGKLKAALNAEARERQLKKSYEKDLDPFNPDGGEGERAGGVPALDAAPSEAEGMPAVRVALAPSNKASAVRAKWG